MTTKEQNLNSNSSGKCIVLHFTTVWRMGKTTVRKEKEGQNEILWHLHTLARELWGEPPNKGSPWGDLGIQVWDLYHSNGRSVRIPNLCFIFANEQVYANYGKKPLRVSTSYFCRELIFSSENMRKGFPSWREQLCKIWRRSDKFEAYNREYRVPEICISLLGCKNFWHIWNPHTTAVRMIYVSYLDPQITWGTPLVRCR